MQMSGKLGARAARADGPAGRSRRRRRRRRRQVRLRLLQQLLRRRRQRRVLATVKFQRSTNSQRNLHREQLLGARTAHVDNIGLPAVRLRDVFSTSLRGL